jgi:hypothetical protein
MNMTVEGGVAIHQCSFLQKHFKRPSQHDHIKFHNSKMLLFLHVMLHINKNHLLLAQFLNCKASCGLDIEWYLYIGMAIQQKHQQSRFFHQRYL